VEGNQAKRAKTSGPSWNRKASNAPYVVPFPSDTTTNGKLARPREREREREFRAYNNKRYEEDYDDSSDYGDYDYEYRSHLVPPFLQKQAISQPPTKNIIATTPSPREFSFRAKEFSRKHKSYEQSHFSMTAGNFLVFNYFVLKF
jgi:hypothetical protein